MRLSKICGSFNPRTYILSASESSALQLRCGKELPRRKIVLSGHIHEISLLFLSRTSSKNNNITPTYLYPYLLLVSSDVAEVFLSRWLLVTLIASCQPAKGCVRRALYPHSPLFLSVSSVTHPNLSIAVDLNFCFSFERVALL